MFHEVNEREEYGEHVVTGVRPRHDALVHDLRALLVNLHQCLQLLVVVLNTVDGVGEPQLSHAVLDSVPYPRRPRLPVPRAVPARALMRRRAQHVHLDGIVQVIRVPPPQVRIRRRRLHRPLVRGSHPRRVHAGGDLEVDIRPVRLTDRAGLALRLGGGDGALQRLPRGGFRSSLREGCRGARV